MAKYPENTLILTVDPFVGFMPNELRAWLCEHTDDASLAAALAAVNNHTGCLGHDLGEVNDPWLLYAFEEWRVLEKDLYGIVFKSMETAVLRGEADYDLTREGLYYKALQFMEKNGFRDGTGWYIESENEYEKDH